MTNVTNIRIFDDASGASALVSVDGMLFSCDYLGEPKINLVQDRSYSTRASKKAFGFARAAYMGEVVAKLTPEWLARNAEWYA